MASDLTEHLEEVVTTQDSSQVPVVIRMHRDLHAALKAQAAKDERSMAQAIRYAIRLYVDGKFD